MQLIAKADGDLIFKMSEDEAAIIAGFKNTYDRGWENLIKPKFYGAKPLPIGTEIQVRPTSDWINRLKQREEAVVELSSTLHNLADQISINLPTVVLLPETKA